MLRDQRDGADDRRRDAAATDDPAEAGQ
jgi:hypothetical protein